MPQPPRLVHSGRCWPRVGHPGSGLQLCPQCGQYSSPPRAAAVSSVAKQEDWTRAQADLKGLPAFSLLELDRSPSSFPKAGPSHPPPSWPCAASGFAGWLFREEAPQDMEGSMRVRKSPGLKVIPEFDSWCCEYRNPGQGASFLTLVLVSS